MKFWAIRWDQSAAKAGRIWLIGPDRCEEGKGPAGIGGYTHRPSTEVTRSGTQQEGKKPRGQEGTPATSPGCDALTLQKNGRAGDFFNPAFRLLGYFHKRLNALRLEG